MDTINEKRMNFKSNIKINFNGGDLTSDSGGLIYKEFDNKLGFSKTIQDNIDINDGIEHRKHENEDVIMQRIYQNLLGYHSDNAANNLRDDTTLQTILEKEDLASQPTISRVNNAHSKENIEQYQNANFELLDTIYEKETPEKITFDLDSTNSDTYGQQYGSDYNSHYGSNGYHPLLMFDGETGDAIKAELRSGNVYTSRQVVRFVGPVFKDFNQKYKDTEFYLRADSGFAKPGLYEINFSYSIRFLVMVSPE